MDWNETRKDSDLGTVTFDLKSLAEDGEQAGINGEVIYDGKPRGMVKFDVNYFPVLKETKGPDGTVEPVPETSSSFSSLFLFLFPLALIHFCPSLSSPAPSPELRL
jgi:Ca2+-dependent lipid-binding protein